MGAFFEDGLQWYSNVWDQNHGPLVWAPNLEFLYTQYIPHTNKGSYF